MLIRSLTKVVFTPGHKPESRWLFLRAHTVPVSASPSVLVLKIPKFRGLYEISCTLFPFNYTDLFMYVRRAGFAEVRGQLVGISLLPQWVPGIELTAARFSSKGFYQLSSHWPPNCTLQLSFCG